MSRKALFQKRPHRLDLPGGPVWVRSFTVGELLKVEEMRDGKSEGDVLSFTLRQCVVDEQGERLLEDDADITEVPLETVHAVFTAVNTLTKGGKLETLAKNSDGTA